MSYNKDSIKSLSLMDHIRKRPGMYIPDIGVQGLHHLIEEVINNSVDEYLIGSGNHVEVTVFEDGKGETRVSILDNGRGIPVGYRTDMKMDILTAIFTESFTGGKFDAGNYNTSSGMNGIGLKAVNALSSSMTVAVTHANEPNIVYLQSFSKGIPSSKVMKSIDEPTVTNPPGTLITFIPDPSIFETTSYDIPMLKERLSFLASIVPGLRLTLHHIHDNQTDTDTWLETNKLELIHEQGKLSEFDQANNLLEFSYDSTMVSIRLSYYQSSRSFVSSFVNTIHTYDNGSHVDCCRDAIVNSLKRLTGKVFSKSQISTGLGLTISVFCNEPIFRGQAKSQLHDNKIYKDIYNAVYPVLYAALEKNKTFLSYIVDLINSQEKAIQELDIKKAINTIKASSKENKLPLKLTVAYNCTVDERELIIVEGDSAAGGVKTARNSFQEVLPIKGKILNAYKTMYTDLLKSPEVMDVFLAIGSMESSGTPLRTKNVYILSDSDPDGGHIQSLFLSLMAVVYPSFIRDHNLSIIHAPLFTIISGDVRMYGHSVKDVTTKFKTKYKNRAYEICRNKGLGEMDAIELREVIDPKTRVTTQVSLGKSSLMELEKLMGNFTEIRKLIVDELEN